MNAGEIATQLGIASVIGAFCWWTIQRVIEVVRANEQNKKELELFKKDVELIKSNLIHQDARLEYRVTQIEDVLAKSPNVEYHKRRLPP
ncbi:MAG: hypothetical protein KME17_08215 [Cyanosarcina radialis HA8281-LM2]|jgi:hypothetical protein|nr:hypothetical protein [Cyanosarcina radialis HA8281-LM2]